MTVTRDWLERLYGRSPGYFAVTPFKSGKPLKTKWYSTSDKDIGRAARSIEHAADRMDIYVSVATHKVIPESGRGKYTTVTSLPGFWADLDIGAEGHKPAALPNPETEAQALSIIDGLPEPSTIFHSGGGLQVWWLFDEPWTFDDYHSAAEASDAWHTMLVQRGASQGLHVDKVGDLTRILRVPGSSNHKTGVARPVEVRTTNGPDHPAAHLSSLGIPEELVREHQGTASIVDDTFPLSWAEILEPHGYTFAGGEADPGAALWCRPGKNPSEGHSLTTNSYGLPVAVNFSASDPKLPSGPNQKLTKLRVYALLNFDGDTKAAKEAIKKLVKLGPDDWAKVAEKFALSRVDWPRLWTEEDPEPDWLVEPIVTRGGQAVIFSEPKAGKSLLTQEIVLALVTGNHVLCSTGCNVDHPRLRVLYIDQENTKKDLRRNGGAFGYEGNPLENLHYYLFPDLAFLDTDRGGMELHCLAQHHKVDVVILDTLSRVVEGAEDESDTYHSFYKYTGVRLKASGIGLIRLDHSGKDSGRGMRGSSAKASDVDFVWQLSAEGDGYGAYITLTRTHSRSPDGARELTLHRTGDPLRHLVLENGQQVQSQLEQDLEDLDEGIMEDALG